MKLSKKFLTDRDAGLESLRVRRKVLFASLLSGLASLGGLILALTGARFLVSGSNSELYSAIFSVSATVTSIVFFAFMTLRDRSIRRKEIFKLVKSRHIDFFEWVQSDVARLINKDRTNEGLLTGSSQ